MTKSFNFIRKCLEGVGFLHFSKFVSFWSTSICQKLIKIDLLEIGIIFFIKTNLLKVGFIFFIKTYLLEMGVIFFVKTDLLEIGIIFLI